MLFTAEARATGEGAVLLMKVQCYRGGCCVTDEGAVLQGRVLLLLTIVYVSLHKTAQCGIIKVFLKTELSHWALCYWRMCYLLHILLCYWGGCCILLKGVLCYYRWYCYRGGCCVIVYGALCY